MDKYLTVFYNIELEQIIFIQTQMYSEEGGGVFEF